VRLCTARQRYTFWCKLVILGVLDVNRCRGSATHVAVLGKIEVSEVGAERSQQDIFVVGIGAIGAFERGDERSLESRANYKAVSMRFEWIAKGLYRI